MSTIPTTAPIRLSEVRPAATAYRQAFVGLLARDFSVLRRQLGSFLPRTLIQPLLLVFVFTYVFPKIGQGPGGPTASVLSGAARAQADAAAKQFSTALAAGVVALSIMFQGIQSVAIPLVQEFGYTKEIEDRVLAPLPVSFVALEKVVFGALQGLFAALLVFPICAFVPATPISLHINWLVLLTLAPLSAIACSALGLSFGTRFEPRNISILFGIIVLPLTFLGCVYYPWSKLTPIAWLKYGTLFNPLVYVSEGFRAALTPAPHMSLVAVYLVLIGFTALFLWTGITGFNKRVLS